MSIFIIDYRLNVRRTKSPELLLMSPDWLDCFGEIVAAQLYK